jgi:hypothetical protein
MFNIHIYIYYKVFNFIIIIWLDNYLSFYCYKDLCLLDLAKNSLCALNKI